MPSRNRMDADSDSILDALHPTISVAVGLCGVCVWVYTTFATVSALNAQVTELKSTIQDRYMQAIEHSDSNYAKMSLQMNNMQNVMIELRDSIKMFQNRLYEKRD